MDDPIAEARRLLFRADDILTGPTGALVWSTMEALAARIADLEAELAKPVAGPWRRRGSYRYRIAATWTPRSGEAVVLVVETGWRVRHPVTGHQIAHGPDAGPDAERLADAAAAPFWRLTPNPKENP